MEESYTFVGHLSNGEAVYSTKSGCLAVEKDVKYLVEPTPEERTEIYKTMSHVKPDEG